MQDTPDVVIIGTGPAGCAAALHLHRLDPAWAGRTLLIDRARHPRHKLCGGAITHWGCRELTKLGLDVGVPQVDVRELRVECGRHRLTFRGQPALRIVRRNEFDCHLVDQVRHAGFAVSQGEACRDIQVDGRGVTVTTGTRTVYAAVLIAADGANSLVRARLGLGGEPGVARLLEVLTPEDRTHPLFADGVATFDFSASASDDLQGYAWEFPCLVDGRPTMNRGVFDSRWYADRPRAPLKRILARQLGQEGYELGECTLQSFPIRWLAPGARVAVPRVLFAGDAAGCDPLCGEGISFALAYGEAAAGTVHEAFNRRSFGFSDYPSTLATTPLLAQLSTRQRIADLLYPARPRLAFDAMWTTMSLAVRVPLVGRVVRAALERFPRHEGSSRTE